MYVCISITYMVHRAQTETEQYIILFYYVSWRGTHYNIVKYLFIFSTLLNLTYLYFPNTVFIS